jgi:putative Ca2+/H+ antiporter (TMEM165/GDT1 family)
VLATRYPAIQVVGGVWLAFLVQTVVAIAAAGILHLLPARPIHAAAACGCILFAYLAWRRSTSEDDRQVADAARRISRSPWLSSFVTVFLAEWGDLTQLATAALAVQSHAPLWVGAGALLALWAVTLLAVAAGRKAERLLSGQVIDRVSAVVLLVIGVVGLVSAALG